MCVYIRQKKQSPLSKFQYSFNESILVLFVIPASSSGAVFFEKVGCYDPPWLPILSNSHEVFVSHSRPFCDIIVIHSVLDRPLS